MRTALKLIGILLLLEIPLLAQEKEQKRLERCATVLEEIVNMPDSVPQELLDKAECVIVFPSVKKFAFGFGGVFVITQMHGLKIPKWVRWSILGTYLGLALIVYGARDITMIHQIAWIPIIDYLAVFILAGILGLILMVIKNRQGSAEASGSDQ